MIPREDIFRILLIASLLTVSQTQNSRSYDTSDWIPLPEKCETCYKNGQQEQKPTNRVLNLPSLDPIKSSYLRKENTIRTKKSNRGNVEQYLREVSPPITPPRKEQDSIPQASIQQEPFRADIHQQLNQGEIINQQYFRQPSFQQQSPPRDYQKHLPHQVRFGNQAQLLLVPQPQQYLSTNRPLLNVPLPTSGNPINFQNVPQHNSQDINKQRLYETLNPGIQVINHGLSSDIQPSSNNHYNFKQLPPTSSKPQIEKESIQLVYVPLETLNQQQRPNQQIIFTPQLPKVENSAEKRFKENTQQNLNLQQGPALNQHHQAESLEKQHDDVLRELQNEAIRLRQEQLHRKQQAFAFQQHQKPSPNSHVPFFPEIQTSPRPQVRPEFQPQLTPVQSQPPPEIKQQQLQSIQSDFAQQALAAFKLQKQLDQGQTFNPIPPTTSIPTTKVSPTQRRRKAHQPPLAVYMEGSGRVTINDVLSILKNAKTISVQDTVGPQSPQVFVGPHSLEPPEGYAKFDLPYLSTIDNNRVERKVDQLPFFVAPLSYKAPPGYSKIPLPSPHVGSVVISQKEKSEEVNVNQQQPPRLENFFNQNPYLPIQQQHNTIKSFRPENAINQETYRFQNQQQNVFNQFLPPAPQPATPTIPITSRPKLLPQTINQYELEQINNQFLPQLQPTHLSEEPSSDFDYFQNTQQPPIRKATTQPTTTESYITNNSREQHITNTPSEHKSRQTFRPTTYTSISSTQDAAERNKYTVLEEFSIRRPAPTTTKTNSAHSFDDHSTEVKRLNLQQAFQQSGSQEFLPSGVSRLNPQPTLPQMLQLPDLQQHTATVDTRQQTRQQIPDQDIYTIQHQQQPPLILNTSSPTYYELDSQGRYVAIQDNDGTSYTLVNQQPFEKEFEAFRDTETRSTSPPLIKEPVDFSSRFAESVVEQTTPSRSRQNPRLRNRGKTHFATESYVETTTEKFKDVSHQNYKLPPNLPETNSGLHNLINSLEDQAIRSLLIPASIAPTTEHLSQPPVRQSEYEQQFVSPQITEQQVPQYQGLPPQQQYFETVSTEKPFVTTVSPLPSTTYPTTTSTTTTTTSSSSTSTTTRRSRGRQRARISTYSTSSPRKTTPRTRRPTSRTRSEQKKYHQEFVDEYNNYSPVKLIESRTRSTVTRHEATDAPTKSPARQRFRTRTRPAQDVTLTERTNTLNEHMYNHPPAHFNYQEQTNLPQPPPQSYMQYEQPINKQPEYIPKEQIVNQFQPVYNIKQTASPTESLPVLSTEESNDNQKLSVDVLINHPLSEITARDQEPEKENSFVQFHHNFEPSEKEINEQTTRSSPNTRLRGRERTKPKVKSTTHKTTTTSTESPEEDEEEFYGFIRAPNFNRPTVTHHHAPLLTDVPKLYSATYVSSTQPPIRANSISFDDQPIEDSNNVQVYTGNSISSTSRLQFIGEIRPKYPTHTTIIEEPIEITTAEPVTTEVRYTIRTTKPTSKARIRGRLRVPTKKSNTETAPPKLHGTHRFQSRSTSHFRTTENTKNAHVKAGNNLEGQNYPAEFLRAQEAREDKTERPAFQITIDPTYDEEDQMPFSSIYHPNIVIRTERLSKEEMSDYEKQALPLLSQNDSPIQKKTSESQDEPQALPSIFTTEMGSDIEAIKMDIMQEILTEAGDDTKIIKDEAENVSETITKPKGRRRGVWRLVRKPTDTFQTAESQYVGTVIANSIDITGTKKESKDSEKGKVHFVNSLTVDDKASNMYNMGYKEEVATVTPEGKNITESNIQTVELVTEASALTSTPQIITTQESFFDSLYKMFGAEEENQDKVGSTKKKQFSNNMSEIEEEYARYIESTIKPDSDETTTNIVSLSSEPTTVVSKEDFEKTEMDINNTTDALTSQTEVTTQSQLINDNTVQTSPWNPEQILTSTSTEVSHETEICYRGKCVKSSDKKAPT